MLLLWYNGCITISVWNKTNPNSGECLNLKQFGGVDVTTRRNYFGRQKQSFEQTLVLHDQHLAKVRKHLYKQLISTFKCFIISHSLLRYMILLYYHLNTGYKDGCKRIEQTRPHLPRNFYTSTWNSFTGLQGPN